MDKYEYQVIMHRIQEIEQEQLHIAHNKGKMSAFLV